MFQQKLIIRTERVLLQHCSSRRHISSKLTDAIRDKAKQALKRGSDAATEIYTSSKSKAIESARTAADKVKGNVQKRSSAVTQAASNAVKSSLNNVSQQVQSAKTKTMNTVSQQVQSAKTKTTDAVKDVSYQAQSASTKATDAARDFSYQAVATTSEKLKQSSKAAASETSELLLGNVQKHASKAARWFWWWSLAAIGVYAIATTGTREIMRQVSDAVKGQSNKGKLIEKNKDVESSNSPSGEDPEGRSWSTWISCISGLKKNCTETR